MICPLSFRHKKSRLRGWIWLHYFSPLSSRAISVHWSMENYFIPIFIFISGGLAWAAYNHPHDYQKIAMVVIAPAGLYVLGYHVAKHFYVKGGMHVYLTLETNKTFPIDEYWNPSELFVGLLYFAIGPAYCFMGSCFS
jgi:hypothetical protein